MEDIQLNPTSKYTRFKKVVVYLATGFSWFVFTGLLVGLLGRTKKPMSDDLNLS